MTITEIDVDSRGRASLKSAGIKEGRYRVSPSGDGFMVVPVRSYTDAEILALRDSLIQEKHLAARANPALFTEADDLP